MKTLVLTLTSILAIIQTGCETKVEKKTDYGPGGITSSQTYTEDGKVISDLQRILEKEVIRGKGEFINESKSLARQGALIIAQNDAAMKAGQVISESDVTLYNNSIKSIIRTQSRNIISGYDIVEENWDDAKKEYSVLIEISGHRVAQEISKCIK